MRGAKTPDDDGNGGGLSLAMIAEELAAARLRAAVLRYAGELKHRLDQTRLPKGRTGGGRFADEGHGASRRPGGGGGGANALRKPALNAAGRIAAAAAANPTAALAGAATLS